MTTFTYRKVSYLNDPYQKYLLGKGKSEIKPNNDHHLNSYDVKNDHRTTKLLLDVNEYGIFSNLDDTSDIVEKNNGLLTPRSINLNKNIEPENKLLSPPNANNGSDIEKNTTISNKKNGLLLPPSTTIPKTQKRSSFINPLINMNFDVGGIFGNDKDGSSVFSSFLSKFKNDESFDNTINKTITEPELYNKTIEEIKSENRLSQDTIRIKHNSTFKDDQSLIASFTEKHKSSSIDSSLIASTVITEKHRSTFKEEDTSLVANTINSGKRSSTISQNTIKENDKMIGTFNNQLVENLNEQPTFEVNENFLENNVDNYDDENLDFYEDDDKIDQSFSNDWVNQYKDENNNHATSMKSSRSKFSALSNFTLKSTKKLTKKAKKLYKKITKQKEERFPLNPLEIPDSYNEKERAFEEMILRDDTISLSLSNATLTSSFADKNFPLGENIDETGDTDDTIQDPDCSFVSSISSYEDETVTSRKKRHRNAINFEEALKEGNAFRKSLANL